MKLARISYYRLMYDDVYVSKMQMKHCLKLQQK